MKMKKRLVMLFLCLLAGSTILFAQDKKTVSGVVRDNDGASLFGATVTEKGTTNRVTTDQNGSFTIKVSPKATLVISYVGYTSYEAAVNDQSSISIVLEGSGQQQLSEVVVTALGISKRQKALGYAASTIKSEDLVKTGSPNFAAALYGKAPGVRIASTPGGATSSVNITIRGINSVFGKNQPLIVLDGIPIRNEEATNNNYWGDQRLRGNGLLDINPEDIDNISILKGASAAALYGSEAVNGVVLITTKKGKRGVLSVDVTANYSQDRVAYLPKYQTVRGAGAPIHVSNGGQDAEGFVYHDLNGDGIKETRGVPAFTINFGAPFDGKPAVGWDGIVRPYNAMPDRYDGLFQTAHSSNISVAVSQGTENVTTRFSLTRQDNEGISLGAKNSKNIVNLNTTLKLGKAVTTDILVNYINQHTENRPYAVDRLINNFTGMMGTFENAEMYLNKYKTSLGYRFVTGTSQSLTPGENINTSLGRFKDDIADYLWRVKEYQYDEHSNRVIASMTNHWQIVSDLRLRARIATDFTTQRTEDKRPNEIPLAFGNSGFFGLATYQNTILYGDALLTYTKKITPDLELNIMGGYTATRETTIAEERETRDGLSVEKWYDLKASVNTTGADDALNYRRSLVKDAFIGTINGSYKDFLFLEGTIRRDRISTMHPDQNSFVYPSVNASFIFTEVFKDLPSYLDYGKFRASWGIVGNYPDIYRANIAYNQTTLGSQAGSQPIIYTYISPEFGNDGIKPEEKNEIEFGLEARFLKNRLGIEASYYNARIEDQILPLTLPASSGATSVLTNIGTLKNSGIEIAVNATPVKTKDFTWETGVNVAKNKNRVEKLTTGSDQLLHYDWDGNAAQLVSKVGQPMGDILVHPVATNNKGEMIVDPNGMYKVDPNIMIKAGNVMPKLIGGMFNTFNYKGINLDIFMDYRFGGHVIPTGINWMISRGLLEESLNNMDTEHGGLSYYLDANGKGIQTNATQGPGGEKVYHDGMLIDGVTANGQKNTNVISQANYYWTVYNWGGPQYSPNTRYELYVKKNSYIKLREVSLGYTLPSNISSKIGAKRVQLSVFGRNLFYFYRTIKNMDAEQLTAGSRWFESVNNAGTNPSTRSYGIMLRSTF